MNVRKIFLPLIFAVSLVPLKWANGQGIISGNEFNPAISLSLNGKYSSYSNDPEDYEISGFLLDDESGLTSEGFALDDGFHTGHPAFTVS